MKYFHNIFYSYARKIREILQGHLGRTSGKREIAYVILVNDEIHNYMRKLQFDILNEYGVNLGLKATPHITIKLGFKIKETGPFIDYLDQIAKEVKPFEICLNGIKKFDDGIIFLDVEDNTNLESLRKKLLSDLSERFGVKPDILEGEKYHFHATLAFGLSNKDFKNAFQVLESTDVKYRFIFDTLALFCYTGEEWISYKRTRLINPPVLLSSH